MKIQIEISPLILKQIFNKKDFLEYAKKYPYKVLTFLQNELGSDNKNNFIDISYIKDKDNIVTYEVTINDITKELQKDLMICWNGKPIMENYVKDFNGFLNENI